MHAVYFAACGSHVCCVQTLEEVVVSLAARGGVSSGVLEALSRRLAASEMCALCSCNLHHAFLILLQGQACKHDCGGCSVAEA
jgi:hypothetical protein